MSIGARTILKQIQPYQLGQSLQELQRKYGIPQFRKMSDNENVYGASPKAGEALLRESPFIHLYPDSSASLLRERLSEHYKLGQEHFLISNGSEELIRLLVRAYIYKHDEAVMADLTFPRYKTNVLIEGGTAVEVPLTEGKHDLKYMLSAITKHTKMVFICNPNNPTGTIVSKEDLSAFIEQVPTHVLIVLDEAYYEYASSERYLESQQLLSAFSNLVILRTFSKIYGLAGLRCGYAMLSEEIAAQLHKVRDVFNVNSMAQTAAAAALADVEFVSSCRQKNKVERDYLQERLQQFGIKCFPSETNFLFAFSQSPVIDLLASKGILVRQFSLRGYEEAFRITLGTREDHEYLINVLNVHFQNRSVK
ncbi:histidinol-phosphate transaminase [Bacillus lacus]|uniref:Histidinol-phosphate aminotransferase n=1 Tax=Metabacillus lacus TaxID=1983721 RepID=A0A7X2IYI9_9BACI|nr:histidinol-phosphate transaminase [Metabacillus lacus]MRX71832.1 histidinol-phosphate transaminase [Metabacillus lacus]